MKIPFLLFAFLFVNSYIFAQTKWGYTNSSVQNNDSEKFYRDQFKREIAYAIKRYQMNVPIRCYKLHVVRGSSTTYQLPELSSCLTEMGYRLEKIDTLNYDQNKIVPVIAFDYDEKDSCLSFIFGILQDHTK
jgi:hypothetical protein